MHKDRRTFVFVVVATSLWLIGACTPGTPRQFIQPDEMEDILVDYHVAKALSQNSGLPSDSVAFYQALYKKAIFQKHGVTEELFDSSMVYYYTHAERFNAICQRVYDRLEERALTLGATEGELGKFAQYNATGDTANIWAERQNATLLPVPPYNRLDFEIEIDSTFRRGDSFLLQFMCDYIYQDGSKTGVVYLAVNYDNDTTISRNLHFMSSGISQLNFPAYDDGDISSIRGFFYLGDGNKRTTTTRLLFLRNIQFIRFHKEIENETAKKDSLPQDTVPSDSIIVDSVSVGDSVRNSNAVLSVDTGTSANRVAARRRLREK